MFPFWYFEVRARYRRKKFTFAISSPDEFLLFKVGSVHDEIVRELKIGDRCIKWVNHLQYLVAGKFTEI